MHTKQRPARYGPKNEAADDDEKLIIPPVFSSLHQPGGEQADGQAANAVDPTWGASALTSPHAGPQRRLGRDLPAMVSKLSSAGDS